MATSYRNLHDEDLLHQIEAKQDKEALLELFARYKHLALGVCLKYLTDEKKAQEAVKNIFLRIWNDNHLYQVNYFKPWFYKVIKSYCLIELRKSSSPLPSEANADVEWVDYLHLKIKEDQLAAQLSSCIQTLDRNQYDCIRYFYLEGKNFQETAMLMGLDLKEVKELILEGRRNLNSCIQPLIGTH